MDTAAAKDAFGGGTGNGLDPATMTEEDKQAAFKALWRDIHSRHPRLRDALPADARMTAMHRGEQHDFRSKWQVLYHLMRLMMVSDGFMAQVLYRFKARLQGLGVPFLPRIAHRLAIITGQVMIGDPVVIHPGVYIVHGQVVIDGLVEIYPGAVIAPFTSIGLRGGDLGAPTLGPNVSVGTGARVLGGLTVGEGAVIGANAVVTGDVPAHTTVVGAPAKPVGG